MDAMRYFFPVVLLLISGCNQKESFTTFKDSRSDDFLVKGRTEIFADSSVSLIGSASSVKFVVKGDSINLHLKAGGLLHNFIVLEINGEYNGRLKIEKGQNTIPIKLPKNNSNEIEVYKATEAANGAILFEGVDAYGLLPSPKQNEKPIKIEFIGNSITCGYGADTTDIPCGTGEWFDQHNAYLAYGPRVARALNVSFLLSSVSGIGIYRNWNDENIEEPTMPQVYENLYLNADSSKRYNFDFNPDIVSICLGTNDLSNGDGVKPRLPFNEEKYIEKYTSFVRTIYSHYPKAKVALLTSPMIHGEKGSILMECLNRVKENLGEEHIISIFEFNSIQPTGCATHPTIYEQERMAKQLIPFYRNLLENMN